MYATIGNFDGVHIGHRCMIETLLKMAKAGREKTLALTFRGLHKGADQAVIQTVVERVEDLYALGLDQVEIIDFPSVCDFDGDMFLRFLKQRHIHCLVTGPDFRYGKDAYLDIHDLRLAARNFGIRTICTDFLLQHGEKISSRDIRARLRKGDVSEANAFLISPFQTRATVEHGYRRGRQLGFPTANMQWPSGKIALPDGVYATRCMVNGTSYISMTSIGKPLSFTEAKSTTETHIFDFHEDLYGEEITVIWEAYLRPNRKFSKVEDLIAQMQLDAVQTKKLLIRT